MSGLLTDIKTPELDCFLTLIGFFECGVRFIDGKRSAISFFECRGMYLIEPSWFDTQFLELGVEFNPLEFWFILKVANWFETSFFKHGDDTAIEAT